MNWKTSAELPGDAGNVIRPAPRSKCGNERVVVHAADLVFGVDGDKARRQSEAFTDLPVPTDRRLMCIRTLHPGRHRDDRARERDSRLSDEMSGSLPGGDACWKWRNEEPDAIGRAIEDHLRAQDGGELTAMEDAVRAVDRVCGRCDPD